MTYIDLLNDFNQWLESNALPIHSQLMYYKLLHVFNRAGWPETVQVDNLRMMIMTGATSTNAITRARDKLVEAGFITFSKGKKGCPNRYGLKYRCKNGTISVTENVTENVTVSVTENVTTNGTHIKTKTKTKPNNPPTPFSQTVDFSGYDFTETMISEIRAWLDYKEERKEGYKPQGLTSLLRQIQKNVAKYGENAVTDLMEQCMAAGWRGIIWDKLDNQHPVYGKKDIPKGASGQLGAAELEAIQRVLREGTP